MAEDVGEDAVAAAPAGKKSGRKRLILFIVLPVLLLAGTAAGLYFSGVAQVLLGTKKEEAKADAAPAPPPVKEAVFYDLPDMLVNLNTGGKRTNFLKISVSLQLDNKEDLPKVQSIQPRVIDTFQSYLRELRLDDLRGSAGLYRLREELLLRVNAALSPAKIDDVLFRELLVQ